MNDREGKAAVPETTKENSHWTANPYRRALSWGDLGWHDMTRLTQDRHTRAMSDQQYRALGSVAPSLTDGFSFAPGTDRACLCEPSPGSARESRHWFHA